MRTVAVTATASPLTAWASPRPRYVNLPKYENLCVFRGGQMGGGGMSVHMSGTVPGFFRQDPRKTFVGRFLLEVIKSCHGCHRGMLSLSSYNIEETRELLYGIREYGCCCRIAHQRCTQLVLHGMARQAHNGQVQGPDDGCERVLSMTAPNTRQPSQVP